MLFPDGVGRIWFWKVKRLVCASACRQSNTLNSIDAKKTSSAAAAAREMRQPHTGGHELVAPTITPNPRSPRPRPHLPTLLFSHTKPRARKLRSWPLANPPRHQKSKIAGKHGRTPHETALGALSPQ